MKIEEAENETRVKSQRSHRTDDILLWASTSPYSVSFQLHLSTATCRQISEITKSIFPNHQSMTKLTI